MVIDRVLKKHYYIPYSEDNKGTSAKATAELFMWHIWSKENLPISLMFNRETQFVAKI